MFLFKVQDRFLLTDLGLVLTPESDYGKVKVGDIIRIVKPDKTLVSTTIKGIVFNEKLDILIGSEFTKEDVPIGSEIWLNID